MPPIILNLKYEFRFGLIHKGRGEKRHMIWKKQEESLMTEVAWYDEVLKRKDEMLEELKEFLAIESVLDEADSGLGAPFGRKIAEALEYMLKLGERDGFKTKNVDGYAGHIEYGIAYRIRHN